MFNTWCRTEGKESLKSVKSQPLPFHFHVADGQGGPGEEDDVDDAHDDDEGAGEEEGHGAVPPPPELLVHGGTVWRVLT